MEVLVIEDEPMTRRGLIKMLRNVDIDGFSPQLTEVDYAEDAIPYLKNTQFDIILTDIEGGEISGLDLIRGWREKQNHAQWVIVSGYDSFKFAQQAISYGVIEYLLKPVTKRKLKETIERCLQGLKETHFDYIGADEVDTILQKLEESVWRLDAKKVEKQCIDWQKRMDEKSLSLNYYCDIHSHILEVLFYRIKNKGRKLVHAFEWEVEKNSKTGVNQAFIDKCHEIIGILEQKRRGNEIDPIKTAKDFIADNLEKDISLIEVAEKTGFNTSYFSQLFKKETGETFVQFRIRLRMERAKKLLLRKDIKVIDIPFLIGLNDHPHFTKTFKKHTGQTPSEFRREMGVD